MESSGSCVEAKLKITKLIDIYDKSSPLQLTFQYTLDQLDVLDAIEEAILGEDPEIIIQDQLEIKMWRNVIYPQIDYIRRQLTSLKDDSDRSSLAQHLDTIILSHLGRLGHFISCLTQGKREKFESGAFLGEEFGGNLGRLVVKLLTFSGDLVRYRSSNNNIFNSFDGFRSSQEFYELAHRVDPSDGSVFNQLAVIESLSPTKSIPMMIYLYSRALGSEEPFTVAKDNLSRLIKKFGSLFGGLADILETHPVSIDDLNKMFTNYPGEEHLLYASVLALSKFLNVNVKVPNFMTESFSLQSPEMKILCGNTENLVSVDISFLSSLVGSSFISKSIQDQIIKLFYDQTPSYLSLSEHESIQLPLSQ